MENQYMELPREAPEFGAFYCPWCATKQYTHLNVYTVYCDGCGRELTHNGKTQHMPEVPELQQCSDEQLLFMLQQFCPTSTAYSLAYKIAEAVPDKTHIVYTAAQVLHRFEPLSGDGWKMMADLACKPYYPAMVYMYNHLFSEDLEQKELLKPVCELIVMESGNQTAADTLRTILRKEGKL